MDPYQGVFALQEAQRELDGAIAVLGRAQPELWKGPAARAYEEAAQAVIEHAMTTRSRIAHTESLMVQFAAEAVA